jgi:putative transposase
MSQRRACQALAVDRSSVRYRSVRPDDAEARTAMKAVASERRRFGYRRIHVMLERQGIVMNLKKLRRLYREEKLQVRRRGGRKRALGTRRLLLVPDAANQRWSLDFVGDALTDGRRFRILAVVDDFTRECLALVADTSLSGLRVVRELTRSSRGGASHRPSSASCQWKRHWSERPLATGPRSLPWPSWLGAGAPRLAGITLRPASRCRTALVESFNGRLRDELLNEGLFSTLGDARRQIQAWQLDYNLHRPHSALGNIPPAEFAMKTALEQQAA